MKLIWIVDASGQTIHSEWKIHPFVGEGMNKIRPTEETLIGRRTDGQKNAHKDGTTHKVFCLLSLFLCNNKKTSVLNQ